MFMQSAVTWCLSPPASLCRVWLILPCVSQTSNRQIIFCCFQVFLQVFVGMQEQIAPTCMWTLKPSIHRVQSERLGFVQHGSKPGRPGQASSILCTFHYMLLPFASNAICQCGRTHRTQLRRPREPNKQRQIARQSQVPSVLFAQHTRFPQPQSVPKALRLCATHNAQDVDTGQALSDRAKDKGKEKIGKKT